MFACLWITWLIIVKLLRLASALWFTVRSTQAKLKAVLINLSSMTHCSSLVTHREPLPTRELHYWSGTIITLCVFAPPSHPSNNAKLWTNQRVVMLTICMLFEFSVYLIKESRTAKLSKDQHWSDVTANSSLSSLSVGVPSRMVDWRLDANGFSISS